MAQVRAALADLEEAGRTCDAGSWPVAGGFRVFAGRGVAAAGVGAGLFCHADVHGPAFGGIADGYGGRAGRLEQLERTPGVTYGLNPATGRRYNIDGFAWRCAGGWRIGPGAGRGCSTP